MSNLTTTLNMGTSLEILRLYNDLQPPSANYRIKRFAQQLLGHTLPTKFTQTELNETYQYLSQVAIWIKHYLDIDQQSSKAPSIDNHETLSQVLIISLLNTFLDYDCDWNYLARITHHEQQSCLKYLNDLLAHKPNLNSEVM